MLISTMIMASLAIILVVIAYLKGGGEHVQGLKVAANMLIQILPLLVFAFIVAGMVQVLIPATLISRWLGVESGIRGLLIGTVLGSITPGGPFISFPIAAGLLRAGAGLGTMVAFVTSWSLLQLTVLPVEIGIIGWKFSLIRRVCTIFVPPIAGLLANKFFGGASIF